MLAADKLQLQSALKQQATALKEKEFNLHHSNLMTVGTQAAVLAGLDITMFIEFNPTPDHEWHEDHQAMLIPRILKLLYYAIIVAAFCANMIVVAHTTALSVLGAGLALRGPDGSMPIATDVVYEERKTVFYVFGWGLLLTVGSVLVSVWILLRWEAALVCWIVTLVTCWTIYSNYRRVQNRLQYNEKDSVDFDDLLNSGPAAIRVVSNDRSGRKGGHSSRSPRSKTRRFIKRSFSSPDKDQNYNDSNFVHGSGLLSRHDKPSAHYYNHGDEEDPSDRRGGEECYHSYSSTEEGDSSSTMLLMDRNQIDRSGHMKQRRKHHSNSPPPLTPQRQRQGHHEQSPPPIQTV